MLTTYTVDMNKYITDWVAANGTDANCEALGFAQCFLQFNVSTIYQTALSSDNGQPGSHTTRVSPDLPAT